MEPTIIHEDEAILVINKPAGLVVNRSETSKSGTLQDWIETRPWFNKKGSVEEGAEYYSRSGIVHRLDKDTSGVMVIAKSAVNFLALKKQFQERLTQKKYIALVHGIVEPASGFINAPIERNPYNRMRYGVFPGGREAETKYQQMEKYEKDRSKYSLLEVFPKTGRTHQIRVHMKYISHSVVGDPIYGGRKQFLLDKVFCPRLFLHANTLSLTHPVEGREVSYTAALPGELVEVLQKLTQV